MAEIYWCFYHNDKAVGCHVLADDKVTARRCYSLETGTDFFLVKAEKSCIYRHDNVQGEITEPLVMFSAGAVEEDNKKDKGHTAVSKKRNLFYFAMNVNKEIGEKNVVFYLYNSITESSLQIVTEPYTPCKKTVRCCIDLEWQFALVPSKKNGEWRMTVAVDYKGNKDSITVLLNE